MNRTILALTLTLALLAATQALAENIPIEVRKTNACGCCIAWMEHLKKNGFAPSGKDMFAGLLVRFKLDNGVPPQMISCHTAFVDGYVIEGHVPAGDIRRLLEDRSDAVGLAVPGMPLGSPGMDQGSRQEDYAVFLIRDGDATEVFTNYSGK